MKHIRISRQLTNTRWEIILDANLNTLESSTVNECVFYQEKEFVENIDRRSSDDFGIALIQLLDDEEVIDSFSTYEENGIEAVRSIEIFMRHNENL